MLLARIANPEPVVLQLQSRHNCGPVAPSLPVQTLLAATGRGGIHRPGCIAATLPETPVKNSVKLETQIEQLSQLGLGLRPDVPRSRYRLTFGLAAFVLSSCASDPKPVRSGQFTADRDRPSARAPVDPPVDPVRAWRKVVHTLHDMPAPAPDWRPFAPYATTRPPVDAPEEIFVTWWAAPRRMYLRERVADAVNERVLALLPRYPELLGRLVSHLPATEEARDLVAAILAAERLRLDSALSDLDRERVDVWLKLRASKPLDRLREAVRDARREVTSSHVEGDQEMRELLRRRPAEAVVMLERHAAGSDADVVAWARRALLEHALKRGQNARASQLRAALRVTADDPKGAPWARDQAISALMSHDWPGRDEWFISLYNDPTLVELRSGAFVMLVLKYAVQEEPDRLVPLVLPLVGHEKAHVHTSAIYSLSNIDRPEVLRALAPWVGDPLWSRTKDLGLEGFQRRAVLRNLATTKIPGAVPHLIKSLQVSFIADRVRAAMGLADVYHAREAGPAIRAILSAPLDRNQRMDVIRAMATLGELTVAEALAGVEAYAILTATRKASAEALEQAMGSRGLADEMMLKITIGMVVVNEYERLPRQVADELGERAFARADQYQARDDLAVARWLRRILAQWPHPESMRRTLAAWRAGRVSSPRVLQALKLRADFARELNAELRAMAAGGGALAGMAAVMLGDQELLGAVLAGPDMPAKLAVLAAARMVRLLLAVASVAPLLAHTDRRLAEAAERYLESLDSRESRAALYAHHRGELIILGAREDFPGKRAENDEFDPFVAYERELIERMGADQAIDEIHALMSFSAATDDELDIALEVRADAVTLIRGSTRRLLTADEWRAWSARIAELGALDLPPLTSALTKDSVQYEFVHLTRKGGRRLFMNDPGAADPGSPYQRLVWHLNRLR